MKLVVLVVFVFVIACALAKPTGGIAGHGRAALGFATGVVAVPALGLGGGAVGLVSGGPKDSLSTGALGAHAGANIAQAVGGQRTEYYYL